MAVLRGVVTFGLITDVHLCDRAGAAGVSVDATPRYFTGAEAKVRAFARAMNRTKADFVVELGDFSDNPSDADLSSDRRRAAALGFLNTAEAALALFHGPRYHVFGNHDTDQLSKDEVQSVLTSAGIAVGKTWYSFDKKGVHFLVLDAAFQADGSGYSAGNYRWDDSLVPVDEVEWLKADLAATRVPTIVLTHQLLNPQERVEPGFDTKHVVQNAGEVRAILEASGVVVAVFSGHYHEGGYQVVNGIPYVVLQASAAYGSDASSHNQYATVDVFVEGKAVKVVVTGHGRQNSSSSTVVLR